jgi:phenylacetate-coenzyme A ligase PaaK-like adenylate-forming protein
VRTSGSSGEPFTIRRTWLEDKVQFLLRLRALRAMGIGPRDHVVVVGVARPGDGGSKYVGRTLRAVGWSPRTRLDGFQSPDTILRQLARARPHVIVGYPGMLDRLTAPELAPLRAEVRPRLVLTGGEVLLPAMRARLGEAFGAQVIESYASHECPLIAWSCPHGPDLHACDDGVIVELLCDGRPAEPGERGEVVITNLHAYAMPFIRYRLGDLATRGASCPCGQPFSTLGAIQGRMLDYFPMPSGRLMHPYEIVVPIVREYAGWVRQYELVQERTDRIVLRVVPVAPIPPEVMVGLVGRVEQRLEPGVTLALELVDRIPFSPNGKFRPSRSLVHSEYAAAEWATVGPADG